MSAPLLCEDCRGLLSALEPGWDSYRAVPITSEALATVGRIAVVPCGNGGVQLEIHRDGLDIEIEIGPDGRIQNVLVGGAK